MRLLRLLLLATPLVAGCASDPALERQYDALLRDQRAVREEMGRVTARSDQLFGQATNAERQSRNTVTAPARCTAPRGAHRPAAPLAFGPVRFKYKAKTFFFTEAAPFDTSAWQCVQEAPSAR